MRRALRGAARGTNGRAGRSAMLAGLLVVLAVACNVWPSYRGSPNLSGLNDSESTVGVANVATLTEQMYASSSAGSVRGSPVVDNGVVYVGQADGRLLAFDAATGQRRWEVTFPTWISAAPVVSGGLVYAVSLNPGRLEAFATGDPCTTPFPGGPPCAPVWQADVSSSFSSPTVVGGVLYVADDTATPPSLLAFDAAGSTNCGGTPVVCQPLWSAPVASEATPAVVDGVVSVVGKDGVISFFDAAGVTGCAGSPKVCTPLRTTTGDASGFPAVTAPVVDGSVVRHKGTHLAVFDSTGATNCSGTPVVCSPRWTATVAAQGVVAQPAVAYGNIYLVSDTKVEVFDLAGVNGCGGAPVVCTPLWTVTLTPPGASGWAAINASPTIANGVGYVSHEGSGPGANNVVAFDALSTAGCTGSPLACPVLWTATFTAAPRTTPAVANGRLYVGTEDGRTHIFGLPG